MLLVKISLISCKDDKDSIVDNKGLTKDIRELVPDSILKKMEEIGVPLHTGDNPPNIQFSFVGDPLLLKATNLASDYELGHQFAPMYFKFHGQDDKNLRIKCYYKQGNSTAQGVGGFIVGNKNKFSVFLEVLTVDSKGHSNLTTQVYSGEMTSEGIKDFHIALFMIDDYGDPNDEYIPIVGGRLIYDSDGLSEIIPDIEEKAINEASNNLKNMISK